MRRLMLLRHAKTETDAPSGRDQDRRLDQRGHRDSAEIGAWLARHPPFPDFVQVSPAVRAKQTWELVWEAMKDRVPEPQIEFVPELYGAEPTQLLQSIRMLVMQHMIRRRSTSVRYFFDRSIASVICCSS